jgi:hypothetical protein
VGGPYILETKGGFANPWARRLFTVFGVRPASGLDQDFPALIQTILYG